MIVKLDFPPAELFPNRMKGRHFKSTMQAKTKQKSDAYWATIAARGLYKAPAGYIPLGIVFVEPTGHRRDLDNMLAAAKSAIDGVAQALGIDDKHFQPILIDRGGVQAPGAMIVAIGCEIRSGVNL